MYKKKSLAHVASFKQLTSLLTFLRGGGGGAVISLPQGWIRALGVMSPSHSGSVTSCIYVSTNSVSKEVTSKAKTQMQSFCEHKPLNYPPGLILTVSPRSPLGPCNPYLVEEE